jgi:hypothetical protein
VAAVTPQMVSAPQFLPGTALTELVARDRFPESNLLQSLYEIDEHYLELPWWSKRVHRIPTQKMIDLR